MLTSKQRAELRARGNGLEATLMVGKEGVTASVTENAETLLEARELVKGRVLETAGMTARQVCDQICAATGADGVQCVGSVFLLYRKSKKLEAQRAAARARERAAKKENPVRAGRQARKAQARRRRAEKDEYFREQRNRERREKGE